MEEKVVACEIATLKRKNKTIKNAAKILAAVIVIILLISFAIGAYDFPYTDTTEYDFKNEVGERGSTVELAEPIEQSFIARTELLSNVSLYIKNSGSDGDVLMLELIDSDGNGVLSKEISSEHLNDEQWNTFNLSYDGMEIGRAYTLRVCSANADGAMSVFINDALTQEEIAERESDLRSIEDTAQNTKLDNCKIGGTQAEGTLAFGVCQIRVSFSFVLLFIYIINVITAAIVAAVALYVIFRFEKCYQIFMSGSKVRPFIYAIIVALSSVTMFSPLSKENTEVASFEGSFGQGTVNNFDMGRIISGFSVWFLLLVALVVVYTLFAARMLSVGDRGGEAIDFLGAFVWICGVNSVLRLITFFSESLYDTSVFYLSSYLIGLVLVACVAFVFFEFERYLPFSKFFTLIIFSLGVAYPFAVLTGGQWNGGSKLFVYQSIIFAVLVAIVSFVRPAREYLKKDTIVLFSLSVTAASVPLVLSLFIETVNILSGRGNVITDPRGLYIKVLIIFVIAVFALSALLKRFVLKKASAEKIALPMLILGITALSVQIPYLIQTKPDIFESANYGVLITDYLQFGKVPIVEHYGGHMMSGVWEGILYGILNDDIVGAASTPYGNITLPLLMVGIYFLLKNFISDRAAFFATLVLPFVAFTSYFLLGIIIVLAVAGYIKKPSVARAMIIWLCCVWCALYRLDLGFAFDIACVLTLALFIIVEKRWALIKQLLLTMLGTIAVFGVAFVALCIRAGVDPIDRIFEFLAISASNTTWALSSLGNANSLAFYHCYIILPFAVAITILYSVLSKKVRERMGSVCWAITLVLGISYFVNFSRGLVRHSLVEGVTEVAIWTAYLYLAVFITAFLGKKAILPVFFTLVLACLPYSSPFNPSISTVLDTSATQIEPIVSTWHDRDENGKLYWDRLEEFNQAREIRLSDPTITSSELRHEQSRSPRVIVHDDFEKEALPLREINDAFLEDDQTFLDFMNVSFLYSYLGRECPVYVSQSPLQLSGDFSAEQFISEIQMRQEDVPIAIFPSGYRGFGRIYDNLDGISNAYRYYPVMEYIIENYVPLCKNENYAVWCLKDRYDELSVIAQAEEFALIDYGYDRVYREIDGSMLIYSQYSMHHYSLGYLPSIMAEKGELVMGEQNAVIEKNNNIYTITNSQSLDRSSGSYVHITATYDGRDTADLLKNDDEYSVVTLRMGVMENGIFVEKASYIFYALEGTHEYVIRVSSDYSWAKENVDTFVIDTQEPIDGIELTVFSE